MAGDTDFVALFQELGLSANCGLDEFKLAYRRRVAQLHPDRLANEAADKSRLQRLTVMYEAALAFHRRHGRLPGIAASAPPASPRSAVTPPAPQSLPAPRPRLHYYLVAVLALLALLAWALTDAPPIEEDAPADDAAPALSSSGHRAAPSGDAMPHRLLLGMSSADVRALEGEPLSAGASQWDYGPSWISFKCGEVDDWYSSPLRPLKFASQRPGVLDAPLTPRTHPLRCAPSGVAP